MGLPGDNVEGYTQGSPITFAQQLKGNLLLIHGTGDDNCHYQGDRGPDQRTDPPQQAVLHDGLSEPRRTSINEGSNTTRHLRELMTRYLRENLPCTATESPSSQ